MAMGSHQSAAMEKDEWLTPKYIIDELGPFDLDPCAPVTRPWPTAAEHFTVRENGLWQTWVGRVWLNPPYGQMAKPWLEMMAAHGNGIALLFARTETAMWQNLVFPYADAALFLRGRVHFCNVDGSPGKWTGGAPSVLLSYGEENTKRLMAANLTGYLVKLRRLTA